MKIFALLVVLVIGAGGYLTFGYKGGNETLDTFIANMQGLDRIGDILKEPREYHDRKVVVSGTAGGAIGFIGFGIYKLTDSSGSIFVSTQKGIPPEGKAINRLKGTVQQSFTFGTKNILVIVEE